MTVSYQFKVENAKAYSTKDLSNIVKEVRFVLEATDGVNVRRSFFPVEFEEPQPDAFVEYDQLTEQQLIDWALAKIDPAQIEALKEGLAGVLQQMSESGRPALKSVVLPWEQQQVRAGV